MVCIFDASAENIEIFLELDSKISKYSKILEDLLDVEINFSYHNTNEFVLSCKESHYGGLINCYAKKIFDQFSYTSDSQGINGLCWLKHLNKNYNFLQVLTHLFNWLSIKLTLLKISNYFRDRAFYSGKIIVIYNEKS